MRWGLNAHDRSILQLQRSVHRYLAQRYTNVKIVGMQNEEFVGVEDQQEGNGMVWNDSGLKWIW